MQEIEDNFKSNGGKFEEFRIGDLFDIRPTKNYGLTNNKLFATKGNIPVVVNSSMNNGVGGYVDLEPTEQGNIITFSDTTTADSIFYQPKPFVGYSHVQGMFPFLNNWNKGSLQYFVAMFRIITKGKFNYGTKFNRKLVREMKIQLPTQNGEIAFDYMEAYIKELEADRVKELEAYLIATGLKDYTLTAAEQTALETFEKSIKINNLTQTGGGKPYLPAVDFQTFKIGDLFEISTPKRKFDANKITFGGKYPYVARGDKNNGIRGLITEDTQYLNNGNTISFGQDTATMFYQPNAYFTGDKIKIFSFRQPEKFNKYIALSLIATMKLGFSHFAWGASFNVKKLQEVKIQLPTQNNAIDFDFMHTFIRAIEKIVIKEVVEWADKKITATKQVINA